MYLLRTDFDISFPKIAELLGREDHTTVMHACEKIAEAQAGNADMAYELEEIRKILRSGIREAPLAPPVILNSPILLSPLEVIKKVADFYHVDESFVYNGTEAPEVVKVRQVVTHIFKDMLHLPDEDIGRKLGGRTHNTISNWYNEIKNRIESDETVAREIANIKVSLCPA